MPDASLWAAFSRHVEGRLGSVLHLTGRVGEAGTGTARPGGCKCRPF